MKTWVFHQNELRMKIWSDSLFIVIQFKSFLVQKHGSVHLLEKTDSLSLYGVENSSFYQYELIMEIYWRYDSLYLLIQFWGFLV